MVRFLKNKSILIPILVFMSFCLLAGDPNSIVGNWQVEEFPSKTVEFYLAKDHYYYGKVNNPTDKDHGKLLYKKLEYDEKSNAYKGVMTPPDKAVELDVTITIENPSKLKVTAKKYLMTRIIHLTRI